MKIAVAVKQVPAKDAPLRIAESGEWIRETDIGRRGRQGRLTDCRL